MLVLILELEMFWPRLRICNTLHSTMKSVSTILEARDKERAEFSLHQRKMREVSI